MKSLSPPAQIRIKYSSIDGARMARKFDTIEAAHRFAIRCVGEDHDIGRAYAVSADGIGKIEVSGVSLQDFLAPPPTPQQRLNALRMRLETLFDNEAKFGITYLVENPDKPGETLRLDPAQMTAFNLEHRGDPFASAEEQPKLEVQSVFPDGSPGTVCTNYARAVCAAMAEQGESAVVVGFKNEDNPDCMAVTEGWHAGGHDFAIVARRFLVDPWACLVAGHRETDDIVLDLVNNAEWAFRNYGDPRTWRQSVDPAVPWSFTELPGEFLRVAGVEPATATLKPAAKRRLR